MTSPSYPPIPHGRFLALDLSMEAVRLVYELVERVPPSARTLAAQVRRSSTSVPLNLSEGLGRGGHDRTHHWRIAHASSKETTTAIQLLRAMNTLDPTLATEALAILDRLNALTYRLTNPRQA